MNSTSLEIDKLSLQACKSFLSKMRIEKHFVGQSVLANGLLDWIQLDIYESLNTQSQKGVHKSKDLWKVRRIRLEVEK